MEWLALGRIAVGLGVLVGGADLLVRGASRLALAAGVSPLVVGLTVVAFGTSAPELAVSVRSALSGPAGADIAVGNAVGSNIFNVLFVLGLSAAVAPLVVAQQLVRIDVPILIGASVLTLLLGLDGSLGRLDGGLLLAGFLAYTAFAVLQGRRESRAVREEYAAALESRRTARRALPVDLGFVAAGLALLVVGAGWLVDGAIAVARALGVSELVIGLTLVAAGTSLPEAATSVVASLRGERDIAVGNVVGSNLFNLLAVLGLAAVLAPEGVEVAASALRFDLPVMIAVAAACLPVFFTGYTIARWEGFLFLGYYVAYAACVVLGASRPAAAASLVQAVALFVAPLTAVTLAVAVVRQWRTGPK